MNLRSLKSKLKSINNVGQITRAMQLVSAVKMKKSQAIAKAGMAYWQNLELTIKKVVLSGKKIEHPLTLAKKNPHLPKLAIVVSSNKGLCGVFNFNLFKFLHEVVEKNIKNYQFIVLGNKAQQFLFHYGANIIADFSDKAPFEDNVTAIYDLLVKMFKKSKVGQVELYYNRFITSLQYKPTRKILLPLDIANFYKKDEEQKKELDYLVEPDTYQVLNGLFSFYLESTIREAIRESEAAEHSARMIAMKNATDNTDELVSSLSLLSNKLRQANITNELLDMNTAKLAVS